MAADEQTPPFPRVCLAVMSREYISTATHIGIIQSMSAQKLTYHLVVASGPYLDAGRNKAIANALTIRDPQDDTRLAWDWFLFVDSDIEFTPDHLDTLFAPVQHPDYDPTKYPVLGGVYANPFDDGGVPGDEPDAYGHGGFFGPVCYEWAEVDTLPGELNGIPTPTFRRYSRLALSSLPPVNEPWNPPGTEASPSPVCEVAAIGTGFLAIHWSLIDAMGREYGEPLPWFHEPIHEQVHYGEDMGFALRCTEMGYPVLAHRGCTPMHHKTIKIV